MRVAIVNDLPIAVEALRRVVLSRSDHSIAWIAMGGREAIDKCRANRPDVILMDMVMPEVDGVEATRAIMRATPCPILVVTATIEGNAARVYEALGHGAVDAVTTPSVGALGEVEGGAELLRKLGQVALLFAPETVCTPPPAPPAPFVAAPSARPAVNVPLLAIGASTGGPQAVASVLATLPPSFAHPIVIVQHLGAEFIPGFGDWLSQLAHIPVQLVRGPTTLAAGTIYLGAREEHLVFDSPSSVTLRDVACDNVHRPSVDVLFHSLASVGASGVAVLLTGMGRDGARGLLALRNAGWWTIAQDRESSVVWGMPGEAVKLGAAAETLPVAMIGTAAAAALGRLQSRTARATSANVQRERGTA